LKAFQACILYWVQQRNNTDGGMRQQGMQHSNPIPGP
jgi:hypothetical protein